MCRINCDLPNELTVLCLVDLNNGGCIYPEPQVCEETDRQMKSAARHKRSNNSRAWVANSSSPPGCGRKEGRKAAHLNNTPRDKEQVGKPHGANYLLVHLEESFKMGYS